MIRTILLASTLAIAAAGACAQSAYMGVAGGVTNANVDCSGTTSCDKSGSGYKLFGGYNFTPAYGVEALIYDFGKFSGTGSIPGLGTVAADFKTTGFGIAGVGNLAISPVANLMLRIGVGSNKLKATATVGGGSGSDGETSTQLLWGLGLGYKFSPTMMLRGEIDGTSAKYAGDSFDSTLISVGLSVKF